MGHASLLNASVLEQFLIQARLTKAVVSLRLHGAGSRLLGDLHLQSFKPGASLALSGLHARDSVPAEGMPVTLTILLGDDVLTLESTLLPPTQDKLGNTVLRLDWPHESARLHHRRDVRVAAPDHARSAAQARADGSVRKRPVQHRGRRANVAGTAAGDTACADQADGAAASGACGPEPDGSNDGGRS